MYSVDDGEKRVGSVEGEENRPQVKQSDKIEIFITSSLFRQNFINIKSVPDGKEGLRFTYDSAGRDASWAKETEPWVYGWWYWSWADLAVPVSHVDPNTHTITLQQKTNYGLRVGTYPCLTLTPTHTPPPSNRKLTMDFVPVRIRVSR